MIRHLVFLSLLFVSSLLPLFSEPISLPYEFFDPRYEQGNERRVLFITEASLYKRRLLTHVVRRIEENRDMYEHIHGMLVLLEEDAWSVHEQHFYRVIYITSWNMGKSKYLLSWEDRAKDTIDLLLFTKLNPYEEKEALLMPVDAVSMASELSNIEKTAAQIFSILSE